jgi:hypothetical protein
MNIKYGQLISRAGNIGDDLQSLAAGQHLPAPASVLVDRDLIHRSSGPAPVALIMNGWFSGNAEAWPPPPSIRPIFVGFHVCNRFKAAVQRHADYLKAFEPIGVRDAATGRFLESLGIRTETTYCLTLTFPQRERPPADGKTFIVDAQGIAIPRSLRKRAIKMTHRMPPLGPDVTLPFAQKLLEMYKEQASLVITTRLHTALPCMAMGIPVVFFGSPADGRTSIINDIGGTIYDQRLHSKRLARGLLGRAINQVDWSPEPLGLSEVKKRLARAVQSRLLSIETLAVRSPPRDLFDVPSGHAQALALKKNSNIPPSSTVQHGRLVIK